MNYHSPYNSLLKATLVLETAIQQKQRKVQIHQTLQGAIYSCTMHATILSYMSSSNIAFYFQNCNVIYFHDKERKPDSWSSLCNGVVFYLSYTEI